MNRRSLLIVTVAVGITHAFMFLGIVMDDAYISFRYARNLVEHSQLVFNLGERVEGYTNFLWTLLAALPHLFDASPLRWMPLIGLCCLAGLLILVVRCSGDQTEPGNLRPIPTDRSPRKLCIFAHCGSKPAPAHSDNSVGRGNIRLETGFRSRHLPDVSR